MVKEELHFKMLIYALTSWCIRSSFSLPVFFFFKVKAVNCLGQQKEELYFVAAHKSAHSTVRFRHILNSTIIVQCTWIEVMDCNEIQSCHDTQSLSPSNLIRCGDTFAIQHLSPA